MQLDVRNNSLNLIRLILALVVLLAHAYPLSGSGNGDLLGRGTAGEWAVFGFFAVSGYLITASRLANSFGRYLLLRVARIYPAFLVCLVVTATVFAPIAWWVSHGSWSGFLTTPTTPLTYVVRQLPLKVVAYDVAGTPEGVPYPGVWNGSLWTLFHEFCCYLLIGLVLCVPLVRRYRTWLLPGALVASVAVWANLSALRLDGNVTLSAFLSLAPLFLGGAVLQVFMSRLRLRAPLALAAVLAILGLVSFSPAWGWQASAPFVAYTLLWLSTVLPSPASVRKHDISYGVYIYAFPVQQILIYTGVLGVGLAIYDIAAAAVTAVLAILSWLIIENPVLRRARRLRRRFGSPHPVSETQATATPGGSRHRDAVTTPAAGRTEGPESPVGDVERLVAPVEFSDPSTPPLL